MKFEFKLFFVAMMCSLASVALANERVGDFALLDEQGKFYQLSYFGDHQAVAILVSGASSEADHQHVQKFADVAESFPVNVAFWVLNANREADRESVNAWLTEQQIELPVLMDESQQVAKNLVARTFGEVFILNPQTTTLMHRGSTSDLASALTQLTGSLAQASIMHLLQATAKHP